MLKGKVTVVAGASGGIERAIAARFARKAADADPGGGSGARGARKWRDERCLTVQASLT
jgi:NAD(P)-dependent dehydrogenase (short-subunit alcohol dehydrogenase family)